VLLATAGLLAGFYYGQSSKICQNNSNSCISQNQSAQEEEFEDTNQTVMSEREQVKGLINSFQSFQKDSQANRVIELMTEPSTDQEREELQSLQVIPDDNSAGWRIYSANDLSYNLDSYSIDEIKETTNRIIEEGVELTKEKKAELLAAIEAGKKAKEEEKKKIERIIAKNVTEK